MKSEEIIKWLEELGIPGKNEYALPTSEKRFPDGSNYGIEISGVERPSTLKALVNEMDRLDVPVHRIIGMVMGATNLIDPDLKEYAKIAADNGLEIIVTPGPRPGWDTGRQVATPEGALSGMRIRGQDQTIYLIKDIMRCIDYGFRGFLVWDEGMLYVLNNLRENGKIPKETVYKVSIFAGHANAAGAKVLQDLGANTFNPVADLELAELAAIRKTVDIPMDLHINLFGSFGGFNRIYEGPEMARVAAPCYFKIEPGISVTSLYTPWTPEAVLDETIKRKVEYAKNLIEIIKEENPELRIMQKGAKHLAIPKP